MPAVSAHLSHSALSLFRTLNCVYVSAPSPGPGPYLAFPSALRAVRPRAVWIALAGSAGCSQTAPCTETDIAGVRQVHCMLLITLIEIVLVHSYSLTNGNFIHLNRGDICRLDDGVSNT